MLAPHGSILVTGGAGFIGAVLCARLLAAGERVRIADQVAAHPSLRAVA